MFILLLLLLFLAVSVLLTLNERKKLFICSNKPLINVAEIISIIEDVYTSLTL